MSCGLKDYGKNGCTGSYGFLSCSSCGLRHAKSSDFDKAAQEVANEEDEQIIKFYERCLLGEK